jgi:sugar/nucleoside kinase (ribokinase family)
VANDEVGDFYYQNLISEGVQTNLSSQRPGGITGKCIVLITPDADRTMNTYLGISEGLSEEDIRINDVTDSEYLYIEGYLCSSPTAKAAAVKARELAERAGVKTSLTLSDLAMVRYFRDDLNEMIGKKVDMLFCNEDEAKAWVGSDNFEDVLKGLKEISHSYSVTRGPRGAVTYDGFKDQWSTVKAPLVQALDTTGAGDLYAGSFLYGITQGKNFESAAKLACSAASMLVTQYGARLQRQQIEQIKLEER